MVALLMILLRTLTFSYAEDDHCRYFKYCGSSSSHGSSKSAPSASIASSLNPGNISKIKGLGLEFSYQPSNPVGYALVTGNGKLGGALIASSGDNTFFGNRTIEIDDVYLQRRLDDKRYKNKKLHGAIGLSLIDKSNFGLDLGLSAKRHSEIGRINPGMGISGKIYFLNFGYYVYKDDAKIALNDYTNPYSGTPYSLIYGSETYEEKYTVTTLTLGTKIKNFAFDLAAIKTDYKFYTSPTSIRIYSGSYLFKSTLFNLAYRQEESDNLKEKDGILSVERKKSDIYGGVQYIASKNLMIGLAYNAFLLNEFSANLTLFL